MRERVYQPAGDTTNETKLTVVLSGHKAGNVGYVVRTSGVVGGQRPRGRSLPDDSRTAEYWRPPLTQPSDGVRAEVLLHG